MAEEKVCVPLAGSFIDVVGKEAYDAVALVSVDLLLRALLLRFKNCASPCLHSLGPGLVPVDREAAIVVTDLLKPRQELRLSHKLGVGDLVDLLLFFIVHVRDRGHVEAHVLRYIRLLKDDLRYLRLLKDDWRLLF